MPIAADEGFEIVQDGRRILFYNRRLLLLRHLTVILGVLTACCLGGAAAIFYLRQPDRITLALSLLIPGVLLLAALIACLRQVFKRRRRPAALLRPRCIADLDRGELSAANGKVLAPLTEVRIRIKTAGETYCSDELGPHYDKLVLQWGWRREIAVLKSQDTALLQEARAALLKMGCGLKR